MLDLFLKGGPVMYGLLAMSFFGVFIVVYKILFLTLNQTKPAPILDKIKHQLLTQGKTATVAALKQDNKLMVRLLASAIQASDLPRDEIQDEIKNQTLSELPKLDNHMNLLATIVTAAPMLGLLGTILGLMDIFNVISGTSIPDPALLSGGISQALITTVTGLLISIPLMFFSQWLRYRIDVFIIRLESLMHDTIVFCKTTEGVKG
jgi:biopolymer transport protein ExbB